MYVLSYLEWVVITIINRLQPGFVATYSRGKPLTSAAVGAVMRTAVVESAQTARAEINDLLLALCAQFDAAVYMRNALVHAHPMTGPDGAQILGYQARIERPHADTTWTKERVRDAITAFDALACLAGEALETLDSLLPQRQAKKSAVVATSHVAEPQRCPRVAAITSGRHDASCSRRRCAHAAAPWYNARILLKTRRTGRSTPSPGVGTDVLGNGDARRGTSRCVVA